MERISEVGRRADGRKAALGVAAFFGKERGRRNEEWIGGGTGPRPHGGVSAVGRVADGRTRGRVPKAKVMNNLGETKGD